MRLRKILFAICIIILAEMFYSGVMLLSKQNFQSPQRNLKSPLRNEQLGSQSGSSNQQDQSGTEYNAPVNMLLLGLDNDGLRADTILFVNFDPSESLINIMSIERDTQVSVDGKKRKINSLYSIQKERYMIEAAEALTGLPVHYYAVVDFKAFREIIDILGGVKYDVPFDMDYEDATQDLYIHLNKGMQLLDGSKAEQLVRYRKGNKAGEGYAEGDVGRIETQQKFISALITQKVKLKYLSKIDDLFGVISENVRTNVTLDDVRYYLSSLSHIGSDKIRTYSMPGESSYEDGLWYFFYNRKKTSQLIDNNFCK